MMDRADNLQSDICNLKFRPAFTLVELLVVIAVIVVLMALLLPAIGMVRANARQGQCASNQRQVFAAWQRATSRDPVRGGQWPQRLGPYLAGEAGVYFCPDDTQRAAAASFALNDHAWRLTASDAGRVVLLDYKQVEISVVGKTVPQLDASWPVEQAPRHTGKMNVTFGDGHVAVFEPVKIDPRYCDYYERYWRPVADSNIPLLGCALSVHPAPSVPGTTAGATTSSTAGTATTGTATVGTTTTGTATTTSTATAGTTGGTTTSTSGTTSGSSVCTVTTGDLLAHWTFNDLNDPGFDDSGHGHDAIVYGATYVPNARNGGGALSFNGSTHWLLAQQTINITGDCYTVSAWVSTTASPPTSAVGGGRCIVTGTVSGGTGFDLEWEDPTAHGAPPGGPTRFLHRMPLGILGPNQIYARSAVNDGVWHMLAAVKEGNTLRIYYNGYLSSEQTFSPLQNFNPAFDFVIGRLSASAGPRYWLGMIDDVRVYGRALSSGEVSALLTQ